MMHNTWQVSQSDCHKQPFPHIYCKNFIKLDTYDHLYEQWDNINHVRWKKFIGDNQVELYFHNDLKGSITPRKSTGYVGYWFFRQRTDTGGKGDIHISQDKNHKTLNYHQNTILILATGSFFDIKARKDLLPTRLFCELYFSDATNQKIKDLLY